MSRLPCGCIVADAKNSSSVKNGYEMSGYVKEFCAEHGGKDDPVTPEELEAAKTYFKPNKTFTQADIDDMKSQRDEFQRLSSEWEAAHDYIREELDTACVHLRASKNEVDELRKCLKAAEEVVFIAGKLCDMERINFSPVVAVLDARELCLDALRKYEQRKV